MHRCTHINENDGEIALVDLSTAFISTLFYGSAPLQLLNAVKPQTNNHWNWINRQWKGNRAEIEPYFESDTQSCYKSGIDEWLDY